MPLPFEYNRIKQYDINFILNVIPCQLLKLYILKIYIGIYIGIYVKTQIDYISGISIFSVKANNLA